MPSLSLWDNPSSVKEVCVYVCVCLGGGECNRGENLHSGIYQASLGEKCHLVTSREKRVRAHNINFEVGVQILAHCLEATYMWASHITP